MAEMKLSLAGFYKHFEKFVCAYAGIYILANIVLFICKLRFRAWFTYLSLAIIFLGICICVTVNTFRIYKKLIRYLLLIGFLAIYLSISVVALPVLFTVVGIENTAQIDDTKYSVVTRDFLDTDKYYYEYKNFLVSSQVLRIHEFYTTGNEPLYTEIFDEDGNEVDTIYAPGG